MTVSIILLGGHFTRTALRLQDVPAMVVYRPMMYRLNYDVSVTAARSLV